MLSQFEDNVMFVRFVCYVRFVCLQVLSKPSKEGPEMVKWSLETGIETLICLKIILFVMHGLGFLHM